MSPIATPVNSIHIEIEISIYYPLPQSFEKIRQYMQEWLFLDGKEKNVLVNTLWQTDCHTA